MSGKLGPGWHAGHPQRAGQALLSLKQLTQAAADATPGDTASWELLRTAVWWLDSMIRDLTDPALDETHMVDAAGTLFAFLLGAKSVPDADQASDIDAIIELAYGELLQHLDDGVPRTWMAPSWQRLQGQLPLPIGPSS